MHLIVPFAAPASDGTRQAMQALLWPHLSCLLAQADIGPPETGFVHEDGAQWTLSTPAEQAFAQALERDVADGLVPMARVLARADGVPHEGGGLALLSPAHWHLGTEQLSMGDPDALALDEAASRALLQAVAELFTSEGFELLYGAPTRWYLRHPSLATLPTASLDRVIGRNVDPWLQALPEMRHLRRLQNEVQMLLHQHPANDERERRGLLPVNSFWLSGTGPSLPLPAEAELPRLETRLRRAALADDAAAWVAEWALLDEELGREPWCELTLCGERSWRRITRRSGSGFGARVRAAATAWRRVNVAVLLEAL